MNWGLREEFGRTCNSSRVEEDHSGEGNNDNPDREGLGEEGDEETQFMDIGGMGRSREEVDEEAGEEVNLDKSKT